MTLEQKLELATIYLQNILVMLAPKRTGNLSLNAIRMSQVAPNRWQIIIGGELASYAIYTNEMWVDERWKGKQNPNQGWIENAIEFATPTIKSIMSGEIEQVDLTKIQDNVQKQFYELYKDADLRGNI